MNNDKSAPKLEDNKGKFMKLKAFGEKKIMNFNKFLEIFLKSDINQLGVRKHCSPQTPLKSSFCKIPA